MRGFPTIVAIGLMGSLLSVIATFPSHIIYFFNFYINYFRWPISQIG